MTDELIRLQHDDAISEALARSTTEPRRILIRLFRWDEIADTPQGQETFPRGSIVDTDPGSVLIESQRHDGEIVGRGEAIEDRGDGPYLLARISNTSAGRDLLELYHDGVVRGASVLFRPLTSRRRADGVIERTAMALKRVAVLPQGAYQGAQVVEARARREDPMPGNMDIRLSGTASPSGDDEPEGGNSSPLEADRERGAATAGELTAAERARDRAGAVASAPAGANVHQGDTNTIRTAAATPAMLQRVDEIENNVAQLLARSAHGSGQPSAAYPLLARHATFGEAWLAATQDRDQHAELARALADQITGDNPGLIPPGYIQRVAGIVEGTRRGIIAFGGPEPLPESGMTLAWPKVDDTTKALADSAVVAAQGTEKTEIVSALVSFDQATSNIVSYAGGSDISWQLLRRSSPAYRDAYLRFVTAAWGRVTDAAFVAALVAQAGITDTVSIASGDSAAVAALRAKLFELSVAIESSAVGQPANVVLAASDVFTFMGALADLYPQGNQQNSSAQGVADASTLQINVAGLTIAHSARLASGKMIVAHREAASWHEDGSPFVAQADDVARLGTNVAVWSMGAPAVYEPEGVAAVTVALV